jgi:hypothetical protein
MKNTEEQTGQSPLSFAVDYKFSNDNTLPDVDPDENETGIEDSNDLHEVRVGDDVHEPDPEKDYTTEQTSYQDDEPDPVPSPS